MTTGILRSLEIFDFQSADGIYKARRVPPDPKKGGLKTDVFLVGNAGIRSDRLSKL